MANFSVAAYLPEWRYEGAHWADIASVVTHLILFSIEVTPTGALALACLLSRSAAIRKRRAEATIHVSSSLFSILFL